MKSLNLLFFFFLLIVSLNSCGSDSTSSGGNDSNSSETNGSTITIGFSGIVADGLISGATVCLDFDFSGVCDLTEPTTTTSSAGVFNFDGIVVYSTSFLSIISRNGVDTATGRNFIGELKSILYVGDLDTTQYQYITPLTDLMATNFLDSDIKNKSVLDYSRNVVGKGYTLNSNYINNSPLAYAGIFSRTQEIQQTLGLVEKAVAKVKGVSFTSVESQYVREEMKLALLKQIKKDEKLDIVSAVTNLVTALDINMTDADKSFVDAQLREIKLSIDSFVQLSNLTVSNLNDYQVALENESDKIYVNMLSSNPIPLKVDINTTAILFPPVEDENATLPDTNTTVPDTNTTTPDENTTEPIPVETTVDISLEGYAVDGYLSGSSVCMDLNYDGICNSSEPSTVSSSEGLFTFKDITVDKEKLIPLININGIDTAIGKQYDGELKAFIYSSVDFTGSEVFLTPLTDLIVSNYFLTENRTLSKYLKLQEDMALAFGLSGNSLVSDPMKNVGLFVLAQELEQIKKIVEAVVIKNDPNYTASKKRALQSQIKEELSEKILGTGFQDLSVEEVLITLKLNLDIDLSEADIEFAINQITEIRNALNTLSTNSEVNVYTLPRVQTLLDRDLESAYTTLTYSDLNLSVERVTNSEFSSVNALYDESACVSNEIYTNSLSDSNSSIQRTEDVNNGLALQSNAGEMTLFYPNLKNSKVGNDVIVFEELYYFAFDEAWVGQGATVYLKTDADEEGKYGCFKARLDSTSAGAIEMIKVFRYTDL